MVLNLLHDGEHMTLKVHHPDNPPLFAWTEYEHFRHTGDRERLRTVFGERRYLQKHYAFLEAMESGKTYPCAGHYSSWKKVGHDYMWSGNPSGMDNTPRGRGCYDDIFWVDALAQQGLSALFMARIARILGYEEEERAWLNRHGEIGEWLNRHYWCEEDGCYYDIDIAERGFRRVLTPAVFWPLLAELAPPERAERVIAMLAAADRLGGDPPFPSVARGDPDYDRHGAYWRGGVWLPMAYMTLKALEVYGRFELASDLASRMIEHMNLTFREYVPHTIWECYSPSEAKPSTGKRPDVIVRPDFCGWSALGPISLFIENVIGIHDCDAVGGRVRWRLCKKAGRQGLRNLRLGSNRIDLVAEAGQVEVQAGQPLTLEINGKDHACPAGRCVISI